MVSDKGNFMQAANVSSKNNALGENKKAVDSDRKKTVWYYLHSAITIVIMFGFGHISPPEPITPVGMEILGIFLALLYGWTFADQVWPSILGVVALSLTGYAPLAALLKDGFGNNTVLLMWAMLLIAALVDSSGVSKFIATYFITRKFVLGKPWILISTFFFTVFIMSAMTSSVPSIVVGWGILYCILKQLGYKPGDGLTSYMVVGVVYCCLIGLALFPWKVLQMVVLGMYTSTTGLNLDYSAYIALTLPVSIAAVTGYILFGKFFCRLNVEKLKMVTIDSFDPKDLEINYQQKIIIYLLVALIILLLVPSLLPKTLAVTKILQTIGAHGIAFLILGVLVFLRFGNKSMINLKKCSGEIQWDCIFLTAAMLPFTTALNAESTGINNFLIEKFSLLFSGISANIFIVLVIAIAIVATQFMNNAICGGILFPIIYPFALAVDVSPAMITVLMIYCLVIATLTPAGSPMSALMFSNKEWVSAKDIYKYVTPGVIIVFFCVWLVGVPLGYAIF